MLLAITNNVVQIISEPWPRQYLAASQMSSTKSSVIVGVVTSTGFHFRRQRSMVQFGAAVDFVFY